MQITNGVSLYCLKTKKFKDIGISIRFRNELKQEHAAARSLLALMLVDRCQVYDTKQKMSTKQDSLYGATLYAQTVGFGKDQLIELRSKIINPMYVGKDSTLLQDAFDFLKEVLFAPMLTTEVFEENKTILLSKIHRMEDDPAFYVMNESLKQVAIGKPLSTSAFGTIEDVLLLTLDDVKKEYEHMIRKDMVDILVCGDVEEEEIKEIITTCFTFDAREALEDCWYCVETDEEARVITQKKRISQTNLMMTWFTHTSITDADYYALKVATAILGQFSTSLLFQEVREKRSLCYSIGANLISFDGVMAVTTGIEQEHIDETVALIQKQVTRVCTQDFDDHLLEVTKKMIITNLKANNDSMGSMVSLAYNHLILHRNETTQDLIDKIAVVTKEDVAKAMQKCEYKLCFILTKEDEDETDC